MKQFLTRNWGRIIVFLLITLADFFFIPYQEKFYIKDDIKNFEMHSLGILLLIDAIVCVPFMFRALIQVRKIYELLILLWLIVPGSFVFFFFKPFLTSVALMANRVSARKEIISNCVVVSKYSEKYSDFQSIERKDIFYDKLEINTRQYNTIKQGDTVQLVFKEGWLGINYIAGVEIKKK